MFKKFLHSIQWRIFVYYTLLIAIAIWVLLVGFFFYEKQVRIRTVELELQTAMVKVIPFYFAPQLPGRKGPPNQPGERGPGRPGGPPRPGGGMLNNQGPPVFSPQAEGPPVGGRLPLMNAEERALEVESRLAEQLARLEEDQFYFYVEDAQGEMLQKTEIFPDELLPIPEAVTTHSDWSFYKTDTQFYKILKIPDRGVLVMGQSRTAWAADLNALMLRATLICILIVGVVSAVGFWMIRSSLRPIKEISDTAERIATGDITERIDTSGVQSELGKLATVLNTTFGRLGEALTRQIQFTSDASHELRTPVAAILADCQFSLKRERSVERYRETIEVCHESAQHMRSLIEDLRDLAHFDEKDGKQVSELVDMKEFLANVVSVMNPLAIEKGIGLDSELESVTVELDPMRMRQAVLNLMGNALRYTEEGGQIVVRCVRKVNDVIIEVHDTGIGIPAEKLAHIFDRFYRADEARAAHTGGVGLGLSISKSIVEANGGKISVESKAGEGTCFRIQLAVSQ